jgi:ribosomal RNA-processing protein 9
MSSFFTVPNSQRKRKRDDRAAAPGSKKRGVDAKTDGGRRTKDREESISGSDLDEDAAIDTAESGDESGSDSEDGETAADRRLKLAERYLGNIQEEVDEAGFDAADIDRDLIAERLKKDVDEFKGRTFRQIAAKLSIPTAPHSFFRSDTQSNTAIAVHPPFVYIVSKDKTLTKWELATPSVPGSTELNGDNDTSKRPPRPQRKKPKRVKYARGMRKVGESDEDQGHTGSIISVAVSPSGKFVATGGTDNKLIIWDAETLTPSKTFLQHRDSVCSLSFARHISAMSSGEQLFSGSYDRTIKTWSISGAGHAYVETLFGHQDHVTGVAAMTIDECVSVGARDRTARLWKVVDETQLVFRGGASRNAPYHENNIDCIAPLPPTHFVTGSDSGSLCLWSVHKKKPLYTVRLAHGLDPIPPLDVLSPEVDEATAAHNARHMRPMPRWITALATLPGTDVVLSGSWDGFIRAWRVSEDKKTLIALGPIGAGLPGTVTPPDTPSQQLKQTLALDATPAADEKEPEPLIKGVINDIAVFERRPESDMPGAESKKSETEHEPRGLSIVAAVGKEHRLARWKCFTNNFHEGPTSGGRNCAVVFEVPFATNDTVKADV